MDQTDTTLKLLTLATGLLISYILYKALLDPLRHIPGPFLARYTNIWYYRALSTSQYHFTNISLHNALGSTVRYGPKRISISHPDDVKKVYGLGHEFDKSDWYAAWQHPAFTSLFTEPSNKVHAGMRRKFQATYSMTSMVSYESFADECTRLLCARLREAVEGGKGVDMAWWFQCYAADTVSLITWSERVGFLDAGVDIGDFTRKLHENLYYTARVGIWSWMHRYVMLVGNLVARLGLGGVPAGVFLRNMAFRLITERKKLHAEKGDGWKGDEGDETAPKDFLEKFLAFHNKDSDRFTQSDIFVGLVSNIVAGSDTTAASLSAILYYLLKNPSTFAKLRAEVDEAFNSTDNDDDLMPFKTGKALPYLNAVIQEALRLHPAVGLCLERVVPPSGVEIAGHFLPWGTIVGVNAWVMHYSTTLFGPDAAEFRPERWLEAEGEELAEMNRNWLPFGLGSRTCIGRHISMLEITKLIPTLVRTFDFELVPELEKGEWRARNYWFVVPESLGVKVSMRKG